MNTDVGGIELLSNRHFFFLALVFILLTSCSSSNKRQADIPIVISQPGQREIDVSLVINNVQEEIQMVIPDAYLVFFSYVGECKELPNLQGEIRLDFAQNTNSIFGNRTLLARATVNTIEQTLDFDVKDETKHYPNLESLSLNGESVQEVANLLHAHLFATNRCVGTVVLTRAGSDSPWRARCGLPDEVLLECVEIDPESGKITDLK